MFCNKAGTCVMFLTYDYFQPLLTTALTLKKKKTPKNGLQ